MVFLEAFRPGDNHRAQRIGALDVGVVIDLDPGRLLLQLEDTLHTLQQLGLGGAFRQAAGEGLAGIVGGLVDQFFLFAALGHQKVDLAFRAQG